MVDNRWEQKKTKGKDRAEVGITTVPWDTMSTGTKALAVSVKKRMRSVRHPQERAKKT